MKEWSRLIEPNTHPKPTGIAEHWSVLVGSLAAAAATVAAPEVGVVLWGVRSVLRQG